MYPFCVLPAMALAPASCSAAPRRQAAAVAQDWAATDDEFELELQPDGLAQLQSVAITGSGTATERLTRFRQGV
jgi:hypothetical protein